MAGPPIGTAKQVFKIPPDIKEWTVTKGRSAQTRVAIYLRVSTGEQTTDNQRRELEAVAMRRYRSRASRLGIIRTVCRQSSAYSPCSNCLSD